MQKKLLKILIVLSLFIVPKVYADCSYTERAELNKEVANIKFNYEEAEASEIINNLGEKRTINYNYFKINILNLSDNFYIETSNNYNNEKHTYKASDGVNGIISIDWKDLSKVTTFTFNIYASDKTNCNKVLYRTSFLTIPRYNIYSAWEMCYGRTNTTLCDKYVTTNEVDYDEFMRRLELIDKDNNTNTNTNTIPAKTDTISSIIIYAGIAGLVLFLGIVGFAVLKKKRNTL